MRRFTLLALISGLGLALLMLLARPTARAQTDVGGEPTGAPLVELDAVELDTVELDTVELDATAAAPLLQIIDGDAWTPTALTMTLAAAAAPLALTALPPTDSCAAAPALSLSPLRPGDGGQADVRNATESADDPILSCMWGNPSRPSGYRTVWYRFTAPVNGRVTFDTFGSRYDTVLGVFSGACGDLVPVACNDDAQGFTSHISMAVNQGQTYTLVVADWQAGLVETPELRFTALLEPLETLWEQVATNPPPPAITRHATAVQGEAVYVIGGQTGQAGIPQISNKLYRLDTRTRAWTELADMPGAGYANTTAALVGGRIYLPSGYNGGGYDGAHWVYDIAGDAWRQAAPIPPGQLPFGQPFAWAAAAAQPGAQRYFLTGGLSSAEPLAPDAQVNSSTLLFSTDSNLWDTLRPMNSPRYAHTAAWISRNNRGLCVAGGLSSNGVETILLTNGECYVPGGNWVPTGEMVVPRYGAGSAVTPDGRWIVFGGYDAGQRPVATTEFYDPVANRWRVLDMRHDLGGSFSNPARGWPRGGFVGDDLWVIGGSIPNSGEQPLPLVETLRMASENRYMPFVSTGISDFDRPDDHFGAARRLAFSIPQTRNFNSRLDFYDVYYFDLPAPQALTLRLEVPAHSQFDVSIYSVNKLLWGRGDNPLQGADEVVTVNLPPGRYYAVVERIFPTSDPDPTQTYRITVTRR